MTEHEHEKTTTEETTETTETTREPDEQPADDHGPGEVRNAPHVEVNVNQSEEPDEQPADEPEPDESGDDADATD